MENGSVMAVKNKHDVMRGHAESELVSGAARLNLETMSPRQVRNSGIILGVYVGLATLSFILSALAIVDWSHEIKQNIPINDDYLPGFYDLFVVFQTLGNTLAYFMITFLLIYFPTILAIRFNKDSVPPLPEQLMILNIIILYQLSPGTNAFSLYCVWVATIDYFQSEPLFNSSALNLQQNYFFRSLECLEVTSQQGSAAAEYNAIMSVVSITVLILFYAMICRVYSKTAKTYRGEDDPGSFSDGMYSLFYGVLCLLRFLFSLLSGDARVFSRKQSPSGVPECGLRFVCYNSCYLTGLSPKFCSNCSDRISSESLL